jgi:hypothetical protein
MRELIDRTILLNKKKKLLEVTEFWFGLLHVGLQPTTMTPTDVGSRCLRFEDGRICFALFRFFYTEIRSSTTVIHWPSSDRLHLSLFVFANHVLPRTSTLVDR